MNINFDFYL